LSGDGNTFLLRKIYIKDNLYWSDREDKFQHFGHVSKAFGPVFTDTEISPSDMIIVTIDMGQKIHGHRIGKFLLRFLDIGSWRDDIHDFPFYYLSRNGLGSLLGDCYFIAMIDQLRDIFIDAMIGNACHRDGILRILIFTRQYDIQDFTAEFRVFEKGLIKVAHAKKQDAVSMLLLDIEILDNRWGKGHILVEGKRPLSALGL